MREREGGRERGREGERERESARERASESVYTNNTRERVLHLDRKKDRKIDR